MKKFFILLSSLLILTPAGFAKDYRILSPDNQLKLIIYTGNNIHFEVYRAGQYVAGAGNIFLKIKNKNIIGEHVVVEKTVKAEQQEVLHPVVPVKSSRIENHYRELTLVCKGNYKLVFRIYNDGVAYRFQTSFPDSVIVEEEGIHYLFPGHTKSFYPREESFFSHNEREYIHLDVTDIQPGDIASLPALFVSENGPRILLTESDLDDYPGMWLDGTGTRGIKGVFPHYPLKVRQTGDRNVEPVERAAYLAKTNGTRKYPWRVMIIVPEDKDLLASQMVYKLAAPLKLKNTDWIKPGKVAWDWWNALNVYKVNFTSGVNTKTYKYFIDFASSQGIEYIILDEGWYKLGNLMDINPDVDLEEIVRYGKEKNVGIILWVVWKTLYDQMEEALNRFEALGIKGIKVDFMQRDDQWMVNYYRKVAKEAARRHLLVDFHGAYKPSGLRREYPNVITREGVRGLEWNKWSDVITPAHNVTLPFTRMVAGPMDYTPGAMRNAQKVNFHASFSRPMSQGTRVHQLAMYVVFESPLQMLADNPSNYLREPECLSFLAEVPVTWDETIPLAGKVGEYVVTARRKENTWYIGGMSNEQPRQVKIDLGFLPPGRYDLRFYKDGVNAGRFAEDFATGGTTVRSGDQITLKMAPGGGWVGILLKQ
ncbi:MAG: glycoside hydrolase family 97 protein [Chlorobi bacterium]|nr:glycoside hydrolase family 97 protein [Chlorobiota bacterium]